jgi:hypothetical protein
MNTMFVLKDTSQAKADLYAKYPRQISRNSFPLICFSSLNEINDCGKIKVLRSDPCPLMRSLVSKLRG